MIGASTRRRVHLLTTAGCEYVSENNSKMKRRREVCQPHRRLNPSIASTNLRGRNTLSIPAHAAGKTPPHRHLSEGVKPTSDSRDHAALLAAAAANPAISDSAMRVYTVVVALDVEVTAAMIAEHLPTLTEAGAGQLLGDLTSLGLLRKRLRTIGYNDGRRVRRGAYTLVREGVTQ